MNKTTCQSTTRLSNVITQLERQLQDVETRRDNLFELGMGPAYVCWKRYVDSQTEESSTGDIDQDNVSIPPDVEIDDVSNVEDDAAA